MGTRALIAIPDGPTWKGRYSHFDGYPSHMGHALSMIVTRDGYDAATRTLVTESCGWSSIDPDTPSIEGVEPDPEASIRTAAGLADEYGSELRFAVRAGYGVAYTDWISPTGYQQATLDDWYGPTDDVWQEWVYVLRPEGLEVIAADGHSFGTFAYDDTTVNFSALQGRRNGEVA